MAHAVVEEAKPYRWTVNEAFQSGKTAYRIGMELNGNPFSKIPHLSEQWIKGYNEASASCTYKRRIDHSIPEDRNDRRPRPRGELNVWRPGRTPKENLRRNRN